MEINKTMKEGICLTGFIPLRAEPAERFEMVSQLVFGERYRVLEEKAGWMRIEMVPDSYTGWMDAGLFTPAEEDFETGSMVISPLARLQPTGAGHPILLPAGSLLPAYAGDRIHLRDRSYRFEGDRMVPGREPERFREAALNVLSVPYIWGGRSGFGFDCSGLTQYMCRLRTISMPRDSSEQAGIGQTLSFPHEAEEGDLAFFDNEEGAIIHVGIFLERGLLLHAHGEVRIDPVDQQGIFNRDKQQYTHTLRLIKRPA